MICFNYFKPQRGCHPLCVPCGEKIKDWPTNRLGHND
jgi:hypothetical protein